MIGNNIPRVIRPREIVCGKEDEPYAQRSILGWGLVGVMCLSRSSKEIVSHRIKLDENLTSSHCSPRLALNTQAKEIIAPQTVKQMFEVDFIECAGKQMSVEDQKFLKLLDTETKIHDDGRYIIPLPVKANVTTISDNKKLALKRLKQSGRRFEKNP